MLCSLELVTNDPMFGPSFLRYHTQKYAESVARWPRPSFSRRDTKGFFRLLEIMSNLYSMMSRAFV